MLKSYKYQIYPKPKQEEILNKHFGCVRFIYNWALAKKVEAYQKDKTKLSAYQLCDEIPKMRKDLPWLSEVFANSLQQSIRDLETAFTKFFREKKGFPNFKSKHKSKSSYRIPTSVKINKHNSTIKLPKLKEVKAVFERFPEGKIKSATISKSTTNKFFVSLLVDDGKASPKKPKIKETTTIGVDLGLKYFAITSSGEKIENPKLHQKLEKRIKCLQRRLSVKRNEKQLTKGSCKYRKLKRQLAIKNEKVRNQRNDFLHKVSTRLIRENQTICLEDLNVSGMMKNHKVARAISEASWSEFIRMLKYKAEWYGKNLLFIGRFDPSSKMCSDCGSIKKDLKLSDREWVCLKCGVEHDRDINAAKNIKNFSLQDQNLVYNVSVVKKRKSKKNTPADGGGEVPEMPVCKSGSMTEQSSKKENKS